MNMKQISWQGLLFGTAAAILLAIILGPSVVRISAQPEKQSQINFKNVATKIHNIPAAAFRSDGYAPGSLFFTFAGGYLRGGTYVCAEAPVYFDIWEIAYDFFVTVYDNSDTAIIVDLLRVNNFGGAPELMASTTSNWKETTILTMEDFPVDYPNITYPFYSYFITVCLPDVDTRIYSVRIYTYYYKTFLPYVDN
jgi:hypothetical protein